MDDMKIRESLDNFETTNAFFNNYFANINSNSDLKKIYEVINDSDFQDEFEKEINLVELRNKNHNRYYAINTFKFNKLPNDFKESIDDIMNLYNYINSKSLLSEEYNDAINHKKLLDNIYRKINRIDQMVKTTLKDLINENDKKENKLSIAYFNSLNISDVLKAKLINIYNELILYNYIIENDDYENLRKQVIRSEKLKEIFNLLNIYEETNFNIIQADKLKDINKKINEEIIKYKDKINYLEALIPEKSRYIDDFNDFKSFCNKLIAYDDTNYSNAKQTYEILCDESRFNIYISNFEDLFIKEIEKNKNESKFIYEKVGIKNLKKSLSYISTNYIDILTDEEKETIEYVLSVVDLASFDLKSAANKVNSIVKRIWKETITDAYSYDFNSNFNFICSNNQFKDEKYQAILITRKELERVNDYFDYQIGFICEYNDNLLYITENEDIMNADNNDLSYLKTPAQLEQEFLNFKVCNRIALNGYLTKIQAVYYIDDGTFDKYKKAIELSNIYNLPLIKLKKNTTR